MAFSFVGFNGPLALTSNAILAQQLGIQTTAANIANANAEGYHRNDVNIVSAGPLGGVENANIDRAGNQAMEQQQTLEIGNRSAAFHRQLLLDAQVRPLLGATDPAMSISGALSKLFADLGTLSAHSSDAPTRNAMLTSAQVLTDRINTAANNILQQQTAFNGRTQDIVNNANDLLTTVGQLNNRITEGQAAGVPTGDLEDQRNNAANDLAELIGSKVLWDNNGQMRIVIGTGISLVSSVNVTLLGVTSDPMTSVDHISVTNTMMDNVDSNITGGEAGAIIQVRDKDLQTFRDSLDAFANQLATAFNAVHSTSFSTDGTATSGKNFFNLPTVTDPPTGYANEISVNPDIIANNGQLLATAGTNTGSTGDNGGVTALLALQDSANPLQTTLGDMTTAVGDTLQAASINLNKEEGYLQNLSDLVASQAGVNISEQLLQLSRFQTAFAAATRVVSTVDQMLQALLSM